MKKVRTIHHSLILLLIVSVIISSIPINAYATSGPRPLPNGVYYLRNVGSNKYAEASTGASGDSVHQWSFHGGTIIRWQILYSSSGYYYIKNVRNNMYLGLDVSDGFRIAQYSTSGSHTLWRFEETTSGYYRIICKAAEGIYNALAVSDYGSNANGTELEAVAYQNNNVYLDEWIVSLKTSTTLEAQEQSNWCWAASARMAASAFMDSHISQTAAAVYVKLGDTEGDDDNGEYSDNQINRANEGGTVEETEEALQYILGTTKTYSAFGKRYSESTLQAILDEWLPVIVLRARYNGIFRSDGHFIVIVDYHVDANGVTVYDIFDPWPVNTGNSYSCSYQWLCNGTAIPGDETMSDNRKWDGIVVYEYSDYLNTINFTAN